MGQSKLQPAAIPSPHHLPGEVIISPDTLREQRIPPRQSRTLKWPVLDAGGPPTVDLKRWRLTVKGLVETPKSWNWEEFQALPRSKVFSDFHCVTRWSRLGNLWEGVRTIDLLRSFSISPEARFVLIHAYDCGWTTNVPLDTFLAEDSILADTHDGEPIPLEHGGPLRLVIPRLYAWKSAKWVRAFEFLAQDKPGFWEQGGYHMNGDPWKEERFRTRELQAEQNQ